MLFLLLFSLFVHSQLMAYPVGVEHEIDRFIEQIDQATPFLENAMSRFTSAYSSSMNTVTTDTYAYDSTDLAIAQNPIAYIKYGYISYDNSTPYTNMLSAGADNKGMYVLEVHFKSSTEKKDISPFLADKTLLFIAYGSGAGYPIIYRDTDSGDLGNPTSMASIGGFVCMNKITRCTATAGSHPAKTCNGTAAVQTDRAGFLEALSTDDTNLFYYISGDFSLCATQNSEINCMGC